MPTDEILAQAAQVLAGAEVVLIGAGAGMGVDSGLPDFRGDDGFWRAYPPLRRRRVRFSEMANPRWFARDPEFAWGFYGHRLDLYRGTTPHGGFALLRELVGDRPWFVFTSNVDGQFQRAGYAPEHVYEIHGSIHHLQCSVCSASVWSADGVEVDVDVRRLRARSPLPTCPRCGAVARPNLLMFGDWDFRDERTAVQARFYQTWREEHRGARLVAVELGAGTAIPSVRMECEGAGGALIRINPREPHGPSGTLSLAMGALDALEAIAIHS